MSSTPGLPYVAGIDGLRAIAVLAVIVFHVDFLRFLPGGFTGVDMFFVISGYVISRSLAQTSGLPLRTFLLEFYQRRLLRILPALLLVLTASVLMSALIIPPVWLSSQNEDTGLAAFVGLSNLVLAWQTDTYFSPKAEFNPYLHTWSLGVEEQFYLLLPTVILLWLRYRENSVIARCLLPALTLASLAWCAVQTTPHPCRRSICCPAVSGNWPLVHCCSRPLAKAA